MTGHRAQKNGAVGSVSIPVRHYEDIAVDPEVYDRDPVGTQEFIAEVLADRGAPEGTGWIRLEDLTRPKVVVRRYMWG